MRTIKFTALAVAALMSFASVPSFAQGNGHGPKSEGRHDNGHGPKHDGRHDNGRGNGKHRDDRRGNSGWDNGRNNDRNVYYGARGPEWRRGGHVPNQYRGRQYVVNDWRAHHLNAPPRGYNWVQVGSDYVLVAIATGIIASLILSQ